MKDKIMGTKDKYYINLCQAVSSGSSCSRRKVGAIIVKDDKVISTGYNGTPRGMTNCNEGGCPRADSESSSGNQLEEAVCCHAEENAIVQAAASGTSVKEATMYSILQPCHLCSKMIINSGIEHVVFLEDYSDVLGLTMLFNSVHVKTVRKYNDNNS